MPTKRAKVGERKHRQLAEDVQARLQAGKERLLDILRKPITDQRIASGIHDAAEHLISALNDVNKILLLIEHADADQLTSMVEELEARNASYEEQLYEQKQQMLELWQAIEELSERIGVPVEFPKLKNSKRSNP